MSQRRSQDESEYTTAQRAYQILRIFCWPPCPPCIINKLAFHPPCPPSYKTMPIISDPPQAPDKSKRRVIILSDDSTKREVPERLTFVDINGCLCRSQRIATMLWSLPEPSELLILHSHVNGTDLGGLYDYMVHIRNKVKCEILSYDYCGYGASSGSATESNMLKAGVAVVEYVTNTLNKPLDRVILYGQSIGSVPTAYLASRFDVGGVILHAGLYSGLRLFFPNKRKKSISGCVDPFRNVDFISKIRCPVLFIHGTEDMVIPISHAFDLYRSCKTAVEPFWIEGGGHTGLELSKGFTRKLREFVELIKKRETPKAKQPESI